MNKENCEYRYLCSGGSRGGARLLIPPIIRPNWGPKDQKNFFGDHPPPRHLSQGLDDRAPRYLKVWIRFYYVSFLLFTPRIKLPIKWRIMMSYGFKWFGLSARLPLYINYAEKTTERVSDLLAICWSKISSNWKRIQLKTSYSHLLSRVLNFAKNQEPYFASI